MRTATILQIGLKEITLHKLRSFLTMLGITLGVTSLISLFAIVDGGKEQTLQWMNEVGGLEKVSVQGQELSEADRLKVNRSKGRTMKDGLAIVKKCEYISLASPEIVQWGYLGYKTKRTRASFYGVTDAFLKINKYEVGRGRYITDWDIKRYARVCVIGTRIADNLFKNENPLGKSIFINNQYFKIVGILKKYEMYSSGSKRNALDWKNSWVSIPVTTMQARYTGSETLNYLNLSLNNTERINEAMQQVKNVLLKRHFYIEDFRFDTREETIERIKQTTQMWSIVLGSIGLISLLVGGVGIMNIMLASVKERTKEIGIRLAVGARKRDILMQFMLEAFIISILGGLLGILSGYGFVEFIKLFPDQNPKLVPAAVIISFSFSVGVGLFFGVYPAKRAASLNPIDALRYE